MLGFTVPPRCISGTVSSPPAILPLRTVVTQNRVQSGSEGRAAKNRQCFRYPFVVASASSELRLSHQGWILSGTGEANMANGYTVLEISLEANGVVVPVTYDGGRSRTVAAGDVDSQSDSILPSSFGLSQFGYGSIIWIKGIISVATAGESIPYTGGE